MPGESRRGSKALSHASYDLLEVVVRPKKYYRISNQGSSTGIHKMIVVDPNERWRILKNVVVLSVALMIQYVAYQGTLNLQSSLNAENGLGTIALSVIYLSMGLSCLVLPSWLISRLTCKWTLVFSMTCFVPYIAFQLYSKFYTLIPAGILLGIAAAPMWAAQATYLTQIGQIYAVIRKQNMDGIITLFFGVFFFAWQNADTIGNLLSSQLDYRAHEKYEKLAQELAAERARLEDIEYAKHMANLAHERIVQKAEESDGEVDELEDEVTIKRRTLEAAKKSGN